MIVKQKKIFDFSSIDKDNKIIFLFSVIASTIILIILLVFVLFKLISYKVLLLFVIGYLVGCAMHYLTVKVINKAEVSQYKNLVTKLFAIRQSVYLVTLLCSYLLTKDVWSFVSCLCGILLIKLSIYILLVRRRSHG